MTAPRTPESESNEPDHQPHGIVEELQSEIAHAVEHVPKPVRWTVRKLVLLVGASLVALVVIAIVSVLLYFGNRTEVLAHELVLLVNGTLAQRSDLALDFADVRGNPLREVRLVRARVRFRDDEGPVLLESPSIRIRYSPWGILSGSRRAIEVDLDRPVIRLGRRPDGTIRLPIWKSSGKPPQPGRSFDVRLRLHGGSMNAPAPLSDLLGLDLDAGIAIAGGTQVRIHQLRWRRGFYDTRDLSLIGEMSAGDSVQFEVERLQTPDFSLIARGGWRKGTRERVIHAEVRDLRWMWLAQVTKNHTLEVPGSGRIVVDAKGDTSWSGVFHADVQWNGEPAKGGGGFTWSHRRLVLNPLRAQSTVGNLDGALVWSKLGWQINGHVEHSDPTRWAAINIPGWPAGDLNGELAYRVDTRSAPVARLEAVLAPSELGGWSADRANVTVAFPAVGPDSFRVLMERRGGTMTLLGAAEHGAWNGRYTIENLPLDEWPDGRRSGLKGTLGHGEGTVHGENGTLAVTGELDGHSTDWLGARIGKWKLHSVQGVLLPKPDLTTTAALDNVLFLAIPFDSAALDLHLLDQAADLTAVRAQAGDTVMTMAGRAAWTERGWRLSLDRAAAKSLQFDWTANAPVLLSGDPQGVNFDRLSAADRDARLDVTGRWAGPGGRYDWRMRTESLDLARIGLPVELGLVGRLDGALEVHGPSGNPSWSYEGSFSRPGFQGHRADSLVLSLAGRPHELEVRRAALRLGDGTLDAQGAFHEIAEAWPDTLTAPRIQAWLTRAGRWNGEMRVADFPLERLEGLAPKAKGWAGRLSGRLAVAGSPARPELDANAAAKALGYEGYRVDDMTAKVVYRPERLEVNELRLTRANLTSTASGYMPLVLRAGETPKVPDAPMSWRVEIPNGDLAVLPLFIQQFGSAAGRFELKAMVEGTPRRPELTGDLKVRDGQLRMAGREEALEQVSANFKLDEARITLDSLSARQGARGRVFAHGAVELAGAGIKSYAFDVRLREFTALETGLYAAQFDGDFRVTDGVRLRRQIVPHVEGRADVRRAVILFDFANQSEMQRIAATTQPLFWTYRIQVEANNNLHWQPPDGDIEFNANLNLEQTAQDLIMYGEMHALRGYYWFLSNRFTIENADLTFDNVEGVNPLIEATATTRVQPSLLPASNGLSSTDSRPEPHVVTVSITGRADEPVISFASQPSDWDENQILRELTLIAPVTAGNTVNVGALGDPVENYLTRAINRTLSTEMSRVFQGYVNEWELQREQGGIWGGTGEVIVSVGGQITPQLAWRYRQRVPGLGRETPASGLTTNPFERDVEAEFRLNRFFYITSEVTQRRSLGATQTVAAPGADFNLNLKARWEY
jgi:hypothetical protein